MGMSIGKVVYSSDYKSAPSPDERPGDYLPDSAYALSKPRVTRDSPLARYPDPEKADVVTMWSKHGRAVLSVTSGGKIQDFFMAPNVVAFLAKEAVELLSRSTNLEG